MRLSIVLDDVQAPVFALLYLRVCRLMTNADDPWTLVRILIHNQSVGDIVLSVP